jgi:AcrR family transcriptional regulator
VEKNELEIVEKSFQVFMQFGIKSVTMDDVARHLGVSKKTLYKYVEDKNDLVKKALTMSCDIENANIEAICEKNLNAIDESFEISNYIFKHIQTMHPSIVFDLQKYHTEAWLEFRNEKRSKIDECYMRNMNKGMKEGLYRDDINPEIITKFYTQRFDILFDPEIFPLDRFNPADTYIEIFRYHIRGIASEKGIKYLKEKMKKEKYI